MGTTYTHLMGFFTTTGDTCASGLTISQVYADSGNPGSAYQTDFVELHNPSNRALPLNGHSLQVAAAGPTAWTKIDLPAVSIPAGGFYLIALGPTAINGAPLPASDLSHAAALTPTAGRVALMSNTIVNTSACPNAMAAVDFVGYGAAASCFEGSPTGDVSPTAAAIRRNTGCRDTGSNADDFTIAAPVPRNTYRQPRSARASQTRPGSTPRSTSATSSFPRRSMSTPAHRHRRSARRYSMPA
jgi:hypothetical protein